MSRSHATDLLAMLAVAVSAGSIACVLDQAWMLPPQDLFHSMLLPPPSAQGVAAAGGPALATSKVILVDVSAEERSLQAAVDRGTLARVISKVAELGAWAIAVDLQFDAARDSRQDAELAAAMRASSRVVLASWYAEETRREIGPCCGFADAARSLGMAHLNGNVRAVDHYYREKGFRTVNSLSLATTALVLGGPGAAPVPIELQDDALRMRAFDGRVYTVPVDADGRSLIQYQGPAGAVPAIGWRELIGKDRKGLDLTGKAVFLGSTRTDIPDSYPLPFHSGPRVRISGVEVHAQDVLGILNGAERRLASHLTSTLICLGSAALGVAAGAFAGPAIAIGGTLALLSLLWLGCWIAFASAGVFVNPLGGSLALIGSVSASLLYRTLVLQRRNRELAHAYAEATEREGAARQRAQDAEEKSRRFEVLMQTYFRDELAPDAAERPGTEADLVARLMEARDVLAPAGMVIEGHLGTGGMAIVFAARELDGGRDVALKFLSPSLFHDEESRARFRREANLTSQLEHPNIVKVITSGQRHGIPFIAYERVRGSNLRALLQSEGRLEPHAAVGIAIQVLAALHASHASGIVHRDVKPENVFLTEDGVVKVLDFGIARAQVSDEVFRTRTGILLGTPAYMAPECVRGQAADPSADLYATGVLLYELIVGQLPFARENVSMMLIAHMEAAPPSPRQFDIELPRALESVLMSLLAKAPAERPASAGAAAELLLPFAGAPVRGSDAAPGGSRSATQRLEGAVGLATLRVPGGAAEPAKPITPRARRGDPHEKVDTPPTRTRKEL